MWPQFVDLTVLLGRQANQYIFQIVIHITPIELGGNNR
jgi:hypothetical protein